MITYIWHIEGLEVHPEHEGHTNVVHKVRWRLTGVDENNIIDSLFGSTDLVYSDSVEFTPFHSLTKEQVQAWVEQTLGEEGVAAAKSAVEARILPQAAFKNTVTTPPWA